MEIPFLRRILLLAVLVTVVTVPQTFAAAAWIKSVAAAQKAAKADNKMIFVDLFAQWCGWCHKFEADVYPTDEFQKATSKMVLLRLDTEDGGDGTAFAQRYQISSLPTFVLLNHDMTVIGLIRGYAPAPDFVKMLDNALVKYKSFRKLVSSEATFSKDYEKRLELAKEFRLRQDYNQSEPRLKKLTIEKGVPPEFRDQAYYDLGLLYLVQGRYVEVTRTVDAFSKVQNEGEPYERSRLLMTDVCIARGDLRCAADSLHSFKDEFPNSPLIPNVDMMLPSIERQLGPARQ
jgi:thioredoxin-related protein